MEEAEPAQTAGSTRCTGHHEAAEYGPDPGITGAAASPLPSLLPQQTGF